MYWYIVTPKKIGKWSLVSPLFKIKAWPNGRSFNLLTRISSCQNIQKKTRLSGGFPGPHSSFPVPRSASSARPPCCICPVQGISPKSPPRAQIWLGILPIDHHWSPKKMGKRYGMIGMGKSYIQKWMVKTSRSPRPLVLDDSDEGTYLTLFGINLIVGLDFS